MIASFPFLNENSNIIFNQTSLIHKFLHVKIHHTSKTLKSPYIYHSSKYNNFSLNNERGKRQKESFKTSLLTSVDAWMTKIPSQYLMGIEYTPKKEKPNKNLIRQEQYNKYNI